MTANLSQDDIRCFLERHIELWNTQDKTLWMEQWSSVDLTIEDPVGYPARRGSAALDYLSKTWDNAPSSAWKVSVERLFICGNEAAAFLHNDGTWRDEPYRLDSLEVFIFGRDRSVHWRTYWEAPPGVTPAAMAVALGSPFARSSDEDHADAAVGRERAD